MTELIYKTNPREYQRETCEDFVHKNRTFAAIHADVGLGKSKMAIDIIANTAWSDDVILIIAPNGVHAQWATEQIPLHCPVAFVTFVFSAEKWDTKKAHRELDRWKASPDLRFLCVNIEAFQGDGARKIIDLIGSLNFGHAWAVLDESHTIKNPDTQRSRVLCKIAQACDYRLTLTGTPVGQSPFNLYSQFEFLQPGYWTRHSDIGSYYMFCIRHKVNEQKQYRNIDKLKKIINDDTYIHRKCDCLDLPDKIFVPLQVEMSEEQSRCCADLISKKKTEINNKTISVDNALALSVRLQQVTGGFFPSANPDQPAAALKCNPKLERLISDLKDVPHQKIIITAIFRAELAAIAARLRREFPAAAVLEYHGGVNQATKADNLGKFKYLDPLGEFSFLVGNPASMGVGLNLQASSLMYLYSYSFSFIAWTQTIGRIHRIGTHKNPVYRILTAAGSIDEKIQEALTHNKNVSDFFKGKIERLFTAG